MYDNRERLLKMFEMHLQLTQFVFLENAFDPL